MTNRNHFLTSYHISPARPNNEAITRPVDTWSTSRKDRPAAAGRSGGSWTRRASDGGSAEAWW